MAQGRRTPLDYFFFMRPVLLPPVWTVALLGTISPESSARFPIGQWVIFFVHLTVLFGGVYTLNQICDIESDRRNMKLHFLPERIISLGAAWAFTLALDLAALGLAAIFGWLYVILTAVLMLLGVVYSVGPFPWKNHAWLGLVANAIGHGFLVFCLGLALSGQTIPDGWVRAVAYSLAVGSVYLMTTVPDVTGDRDTGKRTAAVAWGMRVTIVAANFGVVAAIVLAARLGDRHLAFAGAAAWPFFLRALFRPQGASIAAKAAVGALSIAAVIAYPAYSVLLAFGFVATRLFFRWRFGISYPTFV